MEALVSITKWGGELMMHPGELGLITEGALADILIVDGDPLKDLAVLQDPDNLRAIMKDGSFHKAPDPHAPSVRQAAE